MAFTEAQLVAQIDPSATGRVVALDQFIPGTTFTDVYAVGVVYPYSGRSRWVQIANSNTAAQAWTAIQTALA